MASIASFLILEFMVRVSETGSVRVDLLGGTIDLVPLNQILRNTVTLNLATSLKAVAEVYPTDFDGVEIFSRDYDSKVQFKSNDIKIENFDNGFFGPLSFVIQILHHFNLTKNIGLTLESGSPPGAGLGGSSSMGVTIFKALSKYKNLNYSKQLAINTIQNIESKILNKGPCGYQDYYPALYGGVLALVPNNSEIEVHQLYDNDLKDFLEGHISLIYSGALRFSAINNWEVYKDFFDNKNGVREGLTQIADLSHKAFTAIKEKSYLKLLELIAAEGKVREGLFSNIVTPEIKEFHHKLIKENLSLGMKMCGAGGGGCFIVLHNEENRATIKERALAHGMKVLDFKISEAL